MLFKSNPIITKCRSLSTRGGYYPPQGYTSPKFSNRLSPRGSNLPARPSTEPFPHSLVDPVRPPSRPSPSSRRPESALRPSRSLSPTRRSAPPGDKRDGIMSRLNEVDAGTAKELRTATTIEEIFSHYAENGNDSYDLVSLSHALQKVTSLSSKARPWKRQMVHSEDLQRLAAHTVAALREPLTKEEELKVWRSDMALKASKGDKEAEKELARTPEHTVSLRTIASSLSALSRVNLCPPSLLHEVGVSIGSRISRGEANPVDITALAYAYSRANVRVPQLFNKLSARALKDVNEFKELELASLALSFTSLSTAAPSLFAAISTRMIERREQTNTITPQILCNVSIAMARSIRLDEKVPSRLLDDTTMQHSATASLTLEKLSERIESTARKYRVPIVSPSAFTAQGLSTTAWAYVCVLFSTSGFSIRSGRGGGGRLANELIQRFSHPREAATGIAARLLHKVSELGMSSSTGVQQVKKEGVQQEIKKYIQDEILISLGSDNSKILKSQKSASADHHHHNHHLSDSSTVRVVSALGKALIYAPTLSTATSVNIAMMAQAHADLFSLLTSRLALTRWTLTELDQMMTMMLTTNVEGISSSTSSNVDDKIVKILRESLLSETLRLSGLLQMLNASSIIKTLASSTIRILDPASAGGQALFRANIAKEDVYRDKAKNVLLDKVNENNNENESGSRSLVSINPSSSSSLTSIHERKDDGTETWAASLSSRGKRSGGEIREEERLSPFLNNVTDKEASDDERDIKAVREMMMMPPASKETETLSNTSTRDDFTSMLQRVADDAIDTEKERVDQAEAAGAEYKLSFNPLRQAESVALATPFSITDLASIGSSLAEAAVDEPEFWSKVANFCDQNVGSVIENARPNDIAQLALASIAVAPDSHATQILFKVASVFCAEDDAFKVVSEGKDLHEESKNKTDNKEEGVRNVLSSTVNQTIADEDQDLSEDHLELFESQAFNADDLFDNVLSSESLDKSPSSDSIPLPAYDEEPTWSQVEFEAEKRSKLVPKAPSTAVFRLRGDAGPGSSAIETFGSQDKEIGSRERPHVYRGTNSSWTGRILRKSRVDALSKLSSAFTLACPVIRVADASKTPANNHDNDASIRAQMILSSLDQSREFLAESIARKFLPITWLFTEDTSLPLSSVQSMKSKRWLKGLKAFNADLSSKSSMHSPSSLTTSSSSFSLDLAHCRHVIASTSARLADRHDEIPLSRQSLYLQLLLTRDYSMIDRVEGLRLGLKNGSVPQSVVHEAAVRRSASHLVATLMTPSQLLNSSPNRAARRKAKALQSSQIGGSDNDSRLAATNSNLEKAERGDEERGDDESRGSGGASSKLQEPLAVYSSFSKVFGWALTDSLRSRSGCFESSLSADKNIHLFLRILVDETERRLNSSMKKLEPDERVEEGKQVNQAQDTRKNIKKKKKDKERAVLQMAVEVASALIPTLTVPIATKSKDVVNAVNALVSAPSIDNKNQDLQSKAASWINFSFNSVLNSRELVSTTKKKFKKDVLGDGVHILQLMAALKEVTKKAYVRR